MSSIKNKIINKETKKQKKINFCEVGESNDFKEIKDHTMDNNSTFSNTLQIPMKKTKILLKSKYHIIEEKNLNELNKVFEDANEYLRSQEKLVVGIFLFYI
jgi:hypothetical protein